MEFLPEQLPDGACAHEHEQVLGRSVAKDQNSGVDAEKRLPAKLQACGDDQNKRRKIGEPHGEPHVVYNRSGVAPARQSANSAKRVRIISYVRPKPHARSTEVYAAPWVCAAIHA